MYTEESTGHGGKNDLDQELNSKPSSKHDDQYRGMSYGNGINRYNLSLNGSVSGTSEEERMDEGGKRLNSNELEPFMSPAYDEVPIWNILPSYQLYSSTFVKPVTPSNEDMGHDPPTYETASSPIAVAGERRSSYFPQMDVDAGSQQWGSQESNRWEDSILGNAHKLKRLPDVNHSFANKLKISITLTETPGKKGVVPKVLDPSFCEFQQGDSINGFVCIQNVSQEPLRFDAISVVFEGKVTVMGDNGETKRPVVFYKFLNMFEYNASWTPAYIDNENYLDPIDNLDESILVFEHDKIFKPRVVYKKFFTFKIPDKLLDSTCEAHGLIRHCELPPTIGLTRDEFLKNLRKMRSKNLNQGNLFNLSPGQRKKTNKDSTAYTRIRDFSFPDTAISYSVEVRVVGKGSDYVSQVPKQSFNERGEEFIIINDSSQFIRIQPRERLSYEQNEEFLNRQSKTIFNNFVRSIKQKIDLGRDLLDHKTYDSGGNTLELKQEPSIVKRHQLYDPTTTGKINKDMNSDDEFYEIYVPYKKKMLGASSKMLGTISLISPKLTYFVQYVPPKKFHAYTTVQPVSPFGVVVPFQLSCAINKEMAKSTRPPVIKSINAELMIVSYRSKKYPIPIEFTDDMVFQNNSTLHDNVENHLIEPFKKYLIELTNLTKTLTPQVLGVDSQLVMDMKALANLSVKANAMKFENPKIVYPDNKSDWSLITSDSIQHQDVYTRDFKISLDFKQFTERSLSNPEDDEPHCACLVPNFQSCIMGRLYFINIQVKFNNSDSVNVKLPVKIQL